MSVNVIKIADPQAQAAGLKPTDPAKLTFSMHTVAQPEMSIWLMSMTAGHPAFPWWTYNRAIDEDIAKLASLTGISSPQGLFDFLFLLQFKKTFSNGMYTLVPGHVAREKAKTLPEPALSALTRSQTCVYRLEASFDRTLSVAWVPFYQPQVMVRDVSGENLVRYFNAAKGEDNTNSLSFVGVDDMRRMPGLVNLLVNKNEARSERMVEMADWFAVYSSPMDEKHGTCALAYSKSKTAAAQFVKFEKGFGVLIDTVRQALRLQPTPAAVIKILSRLAAL